MLLARARRLLTGWPSSQSSSEGAERSEETGNRSVPTSWWELASYAVLMSTAAAIRLWDLGTRAMHHDESLHAYYSWRLAEGEGYEHLPMTHGPFQFEASAAIFYVLGDSDFTGRLLYALVGTVLVGMPFFLRSRLGRLGALIVSALLVFSPAMLYFSRFARNDILMAVWTLGLVIIMWRYLDEGKNRYLYMASVLLALAFATKETAYIITVILGAFLTLLIFVDASGHIRSRLHLYGLSIPAAAGQAMKEIWSAICWGVPLSRSSRAASFLLLLVTLTLPLWAATVSVLQDSPMLSGSGIVLAQKSGFDTGSATGGGVVVAVLVSAALLGLSVYWGSRWNWSVWWRAALIFHAVWILLFTTFLTNWGGIESGGWRSLAYWLVQQDVGRGNQPWYYYFVITPLYEFLPLILGAIASIYYLRRANVLWQFLILVGVGSFVVVGAMQGGLAPLVLVPVLGVVACFFYLRWDDAFGLFLVFWAVALFGAMTIASEKMPWLLVGLALPLIVLSGKFLGDLFERVEWRRLWSSGFRLESMAILALIPVTLVLLILTIRTGFRASFENGHVPVEMIVYTQTSPDLTRLFDEIRDAADEAGDRTAFPITIDETSGFSWPWVWYLRDYENVYYEAQVQGSLRLEPDTEVMVIHSDNLKDADGLIGDGYTRGRKIRHRWWFPEQTYRELTLERFVRGIASPSAWQGALGYFLHRDGVEPMIGSEDSYVYYSRTFPRDQP